MKRSLFALATVLVALWPTSTPAVGASPAMTVQGSATATLTVHAHVVRNCQIFAIPVDFGNYDPLVANRTQPLDATGRILVQCTKGVTPVVELGMGSNAQGSVRRMSAASDFLQYELFQDSAHASVWGTGPQAQLVSLHHNPLEDSGTPSIYGRVAAGQNVTPGDYDDSVTATVIF